MSRSKPENILISDLSWPVFGSLFIIFVTFFIYLFVILENRRLSYLILHEAQKYKQVSRQYKYEYLQYEKTKGFSKKTKGSLEGLQPHQKVIFLNNEYVIVEEL